MPVLTWRKNQAEMLPLLSKLARMYLAIPATSTQSGRIFSAGGRVCSYTRTNLEAAKLKVS